MDVLGIFIFTFYSAQAQIKRWPFLLQHEKKGNCPFVGGVRRKCVELLGIQWNE